ncbi:MAG: D-alanyl-D-alanine carboxypeptidase [Ruminococcaceae bacterium]|nr:D-alanyl-D-alanine carboxypeptidase [Oscillospiraceae bacterium]
MKKILLCGVFALLLTMSAMAAPAAPEVMAPSALLMERSTGTILYEKNAHERMAPASVTKVMTMLLTVEAIERGQLGLQDEVVTSEYAASMGGSQIFLEPGERMTVQDLLKSIAVSSANDACVAMAEHLAGSEAGFVEQMNARAAALGMENTHFANCCGLDHEEHYTTAYDIALMSRELLSHEMIREYTTIWMDTVRDGAFGLSNTNKLVRFYDGTTGVKTGYTSRAGYCVSASACREGMELIAVILHADTSPHRNADASGLLNFGFANYAVVSLHSAEEQLAPVPVSLGTAAEVCVKPEHEGSVLVEKAQAADVTQEITLAESVEAPVEQGQRLGVLRCRLGEEILAEIPLVATQSVERLGTGEIYEGLLRNFMMKE